MTLIHNERTELLANALDRASTACIAAGLIGPAVGIANHSATAPALSWAPLLGTVIWLFAAIALHLFARRVLGGLQ
ncbi:hypothetical protein HFC70_10620 [Agrobacterium sp. a22-2]|uniref:hypothetical protein n=1 Tax=Agrobacterium sp. a22-2 TaxID=2283840 RepID=UPI001447BB15|nr:hypothetical protein [Agrobacterium sp. a22-2]NKN36806.1 hypothetical protein [Agrobacterium sp. a22-2]